MNIRKLVGALCIASPFIGLFSYIIATDGVRVALGVAITVGLLIGITALGCYLMDDSTRSNSNTNKDKTLKTS